MLHLIQSTWGKDLSETFTSCHGCNLSHENLSVCSGCYNASFCNTQCQENHVCIGTDISVLPKDIFGELSKWLNVKDLGNLRLVSREFNRKLREQFFQRTEIDLTTESAISFEQFVSIVPLMKRVKVLNIDDLNILQQNGAVITHLTFGREFNQDVRNKLPETLTHLTFGDLFNQEVKDGLPKNLTHLKFGEIFQKDVKDGLPKNLTHLEFGGFFNRDVKDGLPKNLKHLKLGQMFKKDIRGGLPKTLRYLSVSSYYPFKDGLPEFTVIEK